MPETSALTEVSFTDPGQTEMDRAEQFEGENMEGGWSKKEQPSECKRGRVGGTKIICW
jgi:hypothetical protein